MGTRGALGFRSEGQDFITYNHMDSYPAWLGLKILDFLRERLARPEGEAELRAQVSQLRLVDEDDAPTEADIERLHRFGYTHLELPQGGAVQVNQGRMDNWYNLLRDTQGDLSAILEAGVMIDSHTFLEDSLFCEWAYVINLDERALEIYRGFQDAPHEQGRYAALRPDPADAEQQVQTLGRTYYPVALVAVYPFDALPAELDGSVLAGQEAED